MKTLAPASIKWHDIRFQRNSNSYRMLIALCQFVLEGMLLTTESGEYKLASFFDEQRMCRLYEKFVLEYYRKHYTALNPSAARIDWALDDGIGTMLPVMQTDITLTKENKTLIIDTKYYSRATQMQYDKRTIYSNNLYQIFTYVKNKAAEPKSGSIEHEVSGILLYARTDKEIQPDASYRMSGNKIMAKTLDLNQEFSEITKQLDNIVSEHFVL